ncbi:MAG: exosome complex protein Rrp42 [Desulfurococcales archaeon]|jgi:exosome complex component RRP42|nr:exosome complex protein Rrp42 [Desulfurococcales archaeon]
MSITPVDIPVIPALKRNAILNLLSKSTRIDGRSPSDVRGIEISIGVIPNANGSAHVRLGLTQVIAGVKAEIGSPFPDTPGMGNLIVSAEFVPLASPTFEPGPPDVRAIELARVIDRSLRDVRAIELEKLAIIPGRKVWNIFIDIYVIDHDGNLVDASSIATLASLATAKIPRAQADQEKGEITLDRSNPEPIPLRKKVLTATIAKIGDYLVADPSIEEEIVADALITIAFSEDGAITGMQKSGIGALKHDQLRKAIEIAKQTYGTYLTKTYEQIENYLKTITKP